MFPCRPSSTETDEILLSQQKQFLNSRDLANIADKTLISRAGETEKVGGIGIECQLLGGRDSRQDRINVTKRKTGETGDCLALHPEPKVLCSRDNHPVSVLSDIVEKDTTWNSRNLDFRLQQSLGAFPVAPHRGQVSNVDDGSSRGDSAGKRQSLFARQFASSQRSKFGLTYCSSINGQRDDPNIGADAAHGMDTKPTILNEMSNLKVGNKHHPQCPSFDQDNSLTVPCHEEVEMEEGEGINDSQEGVVEKDLLSTLKEVDEENRRKLSSMSEQEILAEQKKLLETMNPDLVAFLQAKHKRCHPSLSCDSSSKQTAQSCHDVGTNMILEPVSDKRCITNIKNVVLQQSTHASCSASLPLDPRPEWLNMDKIEVEKLSWMSDLPPPTSTADNKIGGTARFSFDGQLVSSDSDVPVHLGLHHHGEEQERAGYSLQELFVLSRSTNIEQRTIALKILAKIINMAHSGTFCNNVSAPIISSMLDGGLALLLRWALDDNTVSANSAAISVLHALLVNSQDEAAADTVFNWYRGYEVPPLLVHSEPNEETGQLEALDPRSQAELEAELIKKDVIRGLMVMNLLPRLRYILEVCRPSAHTVVQIIEILIRVVRHSSEDAYKLFLCPRLLDTILEEFLPTSWDPTTTQSGGAAPLADAYGTPLPSALKLIRVICSAGRNMAASFIANHNIMTRLFRYLSQSPSEMNLILDVANGLCVESWRIWTVLLQYGLAVDSVTEFNSVIVQRLITSSCSLESDLSSMLVTLESYVHTVAAMTTAEHARQDGVANNASVSSSLVCGTNTTALCWSQVCGLHEAILSRCQQWTMDFTNNFINTNKGVTLLSTSLNWLATYYDQLRTAGRGGPYVVVDVQRELNSFIDQYLLPCLSSSSFSLALDRARMFSNLLHEGRCERNSETSVSSLLSMEAIIIDDCVPALCPTLRDRASIHLVIAITRLIIVICRINSDLSNKLIDVVLRHPETLQYVYKTFRVKRSPMAGNYFSKFDAYFQYHLVILAKMSAVQLINSKMKKNDQGELIDYSLFHHLALRLLSYLHTGDEHLAHDLFSTVIFNTDFLQDISDSVADDLIRPSSLNLTSSPSPLTSATSYHITSMAHAVLVEDLISHLSSMRATYLGSAPISEAALARSRIRALHRCAEIDSLQCGSLSDLIIPIDWAFYPIINIYSRLAASSSSQESGSPAVVATITNALRTVLLLELWRPSSFDDVSMVMKVARIYCVFLAGSDLFLDKMIGSYLYELLRIFCRPVCLDRMNFREPVHGLISFHDLYLSLLGQFESVSFGDSLFSSYLLLPLQQSQHFELREAVWGDHNSVVTALFIPINELLIPMDRFLIPEETDCGLLRIYMNCLLEGIVSNKRSPVFYLIAVHHINRFMYTVPADGMHRKLRLSLLRAAVQANNETVRRHLVYYKMFNISSSDSCMEFYTQLPSIRASTLQAAIEQSS